MGLEVQPELIAGAGVAGETERGVRGDPASAMDDPGRIFSTSGTSSPGRRTAAEMVFLWTSRPRNVGGTTGAWTAGSFRMLATSAPQWMTHARCGSRWPFHAD